MEVVFTLNLKTGATQFEGQQPEENTLSMSIMTANNIVKGMQIQTVLLIPGLIQCQEVLAKETLKLLATCSLYKQD